MAEILYPPKCGPINRNLDENLLQDRLANVVYFFIKFSDEMNNITDYYNLWSELNEIGKTNSSELLSILATCAATEICRNWVRTLSCVEAVYADNFYDLYKNVAKHIKDIDHKSQNYIWKYHLLQTWSENDLFRLDSFPRCLREQTREQLFITMLKALLELGSNSYNPDMIYEFICSGLHQMVKSSFLVGKSALKELLMPLITGNSMTRLLIKDCISYLTIRQCHFLCSLISRRILLNHKCDIFGGLELRVAEKLLLIINNIDAFEPLILVTTKATLNCFHQDHDQITRILGVLLIRYTEKYKGTPWENIGLDTRKCIQLMASRFKTAMINSYLKMYPNTLLIYGSRLLENAPTVDIKFRYFQIFQRYIKHCSGEQREQLIRIFDTNLKILKRN